MPELSSSLRPLAQRLFADRLELAERFVALLAQEGPRRGLIGPREVDRLWERHVLNCAVMIEGIDPATRTLADVGSGAGLPGVVLAIARPDLEVTLIETMQRRTLWLEDVVDRLGLGTEVLRARAEDLQGRRSFDAVTARAVAPLDKLARWTLPLVREGGELLALKGESAAEELARTEEDLRALGATHCSISRYGVGEVEVPTTVVHVRRGAPTTRKGGPRA